MQVHLSILETAIYQFLRTWEMCNKLQVVDKSPSRDLVFARIKSRTKKGLERILKARPGPVIDMLALTFRPGINTTQTNVCPTSVSIFLLMPAQSDSWQNMLLIVDDLIDEPLRLVNWIFDGLASKGIGSAPSEHLQSDTTVCFV